MRNRTKVCPLAIALFAASLAVPVLAAAKPEPLFVRYGHAGLTSIRVEGGTATYVWHTLKGGTLTHQQSLAAYDKHVAKKALTPEQLRWVTAWAERHHVLQFRKRYPSTNPRSYGAAFRSRLEVRLGARRRATDWDDTSRAKGPEQAVEDLLAWGERVTRGR